MPYKTPGVYFVEKNAFPNSVVEVATAVPAFIGYTQRAVHRDHGLANEPWRITSMKEYVQYFGGPPKPRFGVALDDPAPTASRSPDPTEARGQLSQVSWKGRQYQLSRAAGKAGGRFLMHQSMRHFFQNGGSACYVVSVGGYGADIAADALIDGLAPLLKEQEPTMVLTPDAVLLDEPGCIHVQQQVLAHCGGQMRNRMAILDVWGGDRDRADQTGDCIDRFRSGVGTDHLAFAAAYYPWLQTSVVEASELDYSAFGDPAALKALAAVLKTDLALDAASMAADAKLAKVGELIDDLAKTDAQWMDKLKAQVDANASQTPAEKAAAKAKIDAAKADATRLADVVAPHKAALHQSLLVLSPLYARLMEEARAQMNLMPPAAAMAGVYTMVDNSRGVWKAPANVSLAGVVKPTVDISNDAQQDLNVTTTGKSINALRSFVGEGTLVWGARTLDGNSLDWRYINVRRTVIMLEESCRLAAQAMALEPNVSATWATIKAMLSNFLTSVWKRGGLAGAVPEDAYSVRVGLGETMTPEDVQQGLLRVTVLVAISRPAEFIEITFQQQMQKS